MKHCSRNIVVDGNRVAQLTALWVTVALAISCSVHMAAAEPNRQAIRVPVGEESGEEGWSYPIIALRNPVQNLIRIYGQYSVKIIGNNTNYKEKSQFAGCVMRGLGREEVVHNINPIDELMRWDDNFTENVMHTANYVIDCHDPGDWATNVTVRLQNGNEIGRELKIVNMSGKRLGRLGVCSQPLHTNRDWLRSWVDHQFLIGADMVMMHAPKGPHVDDLFSANREKRLEFNLQLAERSPAITGKQPLQKFVRSNTVWQDYWPSPAASYYAEETIFTACHYRFRYAYDYTIQFDIDEFWTPARGIKEVTLPDFLDKYMEDKSASCEFYQRNFPKDCQTRTTGEYASQFTLRQGENGQIKPAMRPWTVRRMHVHGILDTSPEYKALYNGELFVQTIPSNMSYLKHIRPQQWHLEDGTLYTEPCFFGNESDPDQRHMIIDD